MKKELAEVDWTGIPGMAPRATAFSAHVGERNAAPAQSAHRKIYKKKAHGRDAKRMLSQPKIRSSKRRGHQ